MRVVVAVLGLIVCGRLALAAWLSRPVPAAVPAGATASPEPGKPPPLLFAIVDGLRAEAASDPATMPFLVSLGREGARGVAIAGEPTMSAPCVRCLLTGRPPDLYTAFRNFDANPTGGSIVEFLAAKGARAAHAGDRTVRNLVGRFYAPADCLDFEHGAFASVTELDDRAFPFALAKANDPAIDLLTVFLATVDLVGHASGADGPAYADACRAMDERLEALVTAFRETRPGATVLVAADHGLSPRGTHGSGEADARRAPFVLAGPNVARADAGEIPQAAIAPTLCALLSLPPPPLAEAPPAFDVTTIPPAGRASFLDAYVRARLDVARSLGATDVASALDARRAKVFAAGKASALKDLAAVWRDLDASVFRTPNRLEAVACLALAALLLAFLMGPACGARGSRTLSAAGLFTVVLAAGAAFALREAMVGAAATDSALLRAAAAGAVLLAGLALWARRGANRWRERIVAVAEERPAIVLALGGAAIGFPLTLSLAIDNVVHTPILYALAAGAALVAIASSERARREAPRARWVLLAAAALALGGGRALAGVLGDDAWRGAAATADLWLAVPAIAVVVLLADAARRSRRSPSDARASLALALAVLSFTCLSSDSWTAAAGFAVVALGARAAAMLPGPVSRRGAVGLVLAVVVCQVAVTHATGGDESMRALDVGRSLVPSAAVDTVAAGTGPIPWAEAASRVGRSALVWLVVVLPAVAAFRRRPLVPGTSGHDARCRVVADLTLATTAKAVAILAALPAWSPWAWWVVRAYPSYAFSLVNVVLAAVASAVAAVVVGRESPAGGYDSVITR